MSSGGKLILLRIPTANGEPKVENGVWWGELDWEMHVWRAVITWRRARMGGAGG
jgi:hypothetical protein